MIHAPQRRPAPRSGRRPPPPQVAGAARPIWFLDLDDTLHDASHAILPEINGRMTRFVGRLLGLDADGANRVRLDYWRRYGATLLGLVRHHAVDPRRFLDETHDLDIPALLRAERGLAARLRRLPGRLVLLTNAPHDYALRVLHAIGLARHVRARYTIESMRLFGRFRPKPSSSMLRLVLAREGLAAPGQRGRAVLVEDNLANLRAARAAGMRTVLVGGAPVHGPRRLAGNAYVDARIGSVTRLPRAIAKVRRAG